MLVSRDNQPIKMKIAESKTKRTKTKEKKQYLCTLVHVLEQNVPHFLHPLNFVSTSMIRRKLLYILCDFA